MPARDWETFYQANDTPWDKGSPAPGLVDFLDRNPALPPGRVVVPGCGLGHDARAWGSRGFPTVGVDLAPTAVTRARTLTPETLPVTFAVAEFLQDMPPTPFDWLFEHTLYCAIAPDERPLYAAAAARWVAVGGHFLAIHYLDPASPEGPPFPCTDPEIRTRFQPWFDLIESWSPPAYPGREGRERMYWWRRRPGPPPALP